MSKTWRFLKKPSKHQAITTCCDLTRLFSDAFLDDRNHPASVRDSFARKRFYLKLPQKRWMRLQASSRSAVLVA